MKNDYRFGRMPAPTPAVGIATNVFLTVLDEPNSFKVLPTSPSLLAKEKMAYVTDTGNDILSCSRNSASQRFRLLKTKSNN